MCVKFICVEKFINAITTDAVRLHIVWYSFNKIKSVIANTKEKQHHMLIHSVVVAFFVCVRKNKNQHLKKMLNMAISRLPLFYCLHSSFYVFVFFFIIDRKNERKKRFPSPTAKATVRLQFEFKHAPPFWYI